MNSTNFQIYSRQDVADHYAAMEDLTPCEKSLFDEFIKPGAVILDLGVGGGRTTPYLSSRASRYLGVDYSVEMVRRCQQKFSGREFVIADASDLKFLESGSLDAVVFAFNGMDYVIPDEARHRCLEECRRVLRPNGVLVFSSHNPRAVFVRPEWNRDHVRRVSDAIGVSSRLVSGASFFLLNIAVAGRAVFRAAWGSAGRIGKRLPKSAFWRGEGYMLDAVHGGLLTHYSVPHRVRAELQEHQFSLVKFLANDYPRRPNSYCTDWFYYACMKSTPEDATEQTPRS